MTGPPDIFVTNRNLHITVHVEKHNKKVVRANEHLFEFNFVKAKVLQQVKGRINAKLRELGHRDSLIRFYDANIRYGNSDAPASYPNLKHWIKWTFVITIPFVNNKKKDVLTTMRTIKQTAGNNKNIVEFRASESNDNVSPDVSKLDREPVLWLVKLIGYTVR